MNVIVTGCAGFIGSHLCEELISKGCNVYGIDNFDPFYSVETKKGNLKSLLLSNRFHFLEIDITQKKTLIDLEINADIVIHLAAKAGVRPSIQNPEQYILTNILGTQNIVEMANKLGINKIIFASSSSVYGNNAGNEFIENSNTDYPISPYAFTKKSSELQLYADHKLYNLNIIALRFFTVYGPRQRPDLAIHKFFDKIINEEPVPVFGDGNTARDYTYISDIVAGIFSAINFISTNNNIYEIFNLGNNQPIVLSELIAAIEKVVGKKANLNFLEYQPGDVNKTWANIDKAKNLLNYSPKKSLEEGLKEFYNWKLSSLC